MAGGVKGKESKNTRRKVGSVSRLTGGTGGRTGVARQTGRTGKRKRTGGGRSAAPTVASARPIGGAKARTGVAKRPSVRSSVGGKSGSGKVRATVAAPSITKRPKGNRLAFPPLKKG